MFASDLSRQQRKQDHLWDLLAQADFAGIAETHGTIGHVNACALPDHSTFFWAHVPTRANAGVGLAVKNMFLQQFNPVTLDDWDQFELGRMAKLSLRGPQGGLDLIVAYLPTGSGTDVEKRRILDILARNVAPKDEVLTLIMGD